jgi:streptogramin lyase
MGVPATRSDDSAHGALDGYCGVDHTVHCLGLKSCTPLARGYSEIEPKIGNCERYRENLMHYQLLGRRSLRHIAAICCALICANWDAAAAARVETAPTDIARAENLWDVLVTSAGTNGNSAVLRFDGRSGQAIGTYGCAGGIVDPRDIVPKPPLGGVLYVNNGNDSVLKFRSRTGEFLGIFTSYPNLNPGGSVFGPDGNYYVGARSLRAILRFDGSSGAFLDNYIPPGLVAFPRGFTFAPNGKFYLGNGADPATGSGGGTILEFDGKTGALTNPNFVDDASLSPLDVIVGPDKNLYVSSEFPFGSANSVGSVHYYSTKTGKLLGVLDAGTDAQGRPRLSRPRGLGFGPDGNLYVSSTGTGTVVRFNGKTKAFIDVFAQYPNLNGQALTFVYKSFVNRCPLPQ